MNAVWNNISGGLFCTALMVFMPVNATLADTFPAPARSDQEMSIQPEAMAALAKMGAYLNTLKEFTVTSEMSMDEVLLTGQKILVTGTTKYQTRLPDRLRISSRIEAIGRDNEYFYDGKSFTIYSNPDKYYASFKAPGNIGALLDLAENRHNVEIPLRDLFYWGTEKARLDDIETAFTVGDSRVGDTPCTHYAFTQQEVDWQIWIEDDDTPLPHRLVITSKLESGKPQYISTMTWNVAPQLNDSTFVFTPPEGAHQIDFAVYDDTEEPSQQ